VRLGKGYVIEVALATPRQIAEHAEDDDATNHYDGLWESWLGEGERSAGIIYVNSRLTAPQRWAVYWHELVHAVNDVAAHDGVHVLLT
jgi:hypothetical protein